MKITSDRIEHIQSQPGRGHIKPHEILEAVRDNNRQIRKNKKRTAGDYLVSDRAQNGKSLRVCVKLLTDEDFRTELITAWED